ncbi:MAG: glycosyl transferase family 1 [Magnetococcales bacterium]|nr:glycosyl transferase family 1 [Magnetococcales bacterium]
MAKILILISGHLSSAPRPQKEALALTEAGHDVTVCGIWSVQAFIDYDRLLMAEGRWRFRPMLDFSNRRPMNRLKNSWLRLRSRLARETYRRWNHFSPYLLGYGAGVMLKVARQEQADLTIVHSESGLWVGKQLLEEGFRVGVDFEDWFSEDLQPQARTFRPVKELQALEGHLARHCRYCLTTSKVMASVMAKRFNSPTPRVVYNVFPWSDRKNLDGRPLDRGERKWPSLHWFSQTFGPGRGLERLFQALPHLEAPVELHLRANSTPETRAWAQSQVPKAWRDRLHIHPLVPNRSLLSRIAEHDIGFALDQSTILSRDLTITNKQFQYLLAGLPIIASDTRGQREIIDAHPQVGKVVQEDDPLSVANAITTMTQSREKLAANRAAVLEIAEQHYCWEKQAKSVQTAAQEALNS